MIFFWLVWTLQCLLLMICTMTNQHENLPFVFAFHSKILFLLRNQDDSKNAKWNLFKNHPIPLTAHRSHHCQHCQSNDKRLSTNARVDVPPRSPPVVQRLSSTRDVCLAEIFNLLISLCRCVNDILVQYGALIFHVTFVRL